MHDDDSVLREQLQRLAGHFPSDEVAYAALQNRVRAAKRRRAAVAVSTFGAVAPAATAKEVIVILNGAMRKALQSPDVRKLLIERGYDIVGSTPEEFGASIRSDMAKWEKVARDSNIARIN